VLRRSCSSAEAEALTVVQQIQTAQTLPRRVGPPLTGQLRLLNRSVIHSEKGPDGSGTLGEDINPWGVALYGTVQGVELAAPV
jgi:hypothetical protein